MTNVEQFKFTCVLEKTTCLKTNANVKTNEFVDGINIV